MTANANAKYQVQIYSRDHWGADDRFATEAEAVARARKLIGVRTCEGVRVMRESRSAGGFVETEVFKEMQRSNKPLTIQPIEEAPPCQTQEDLLGNRSRMTINRLLRGYVEQAVVTPTEIMHNYQELRRLSGKDNLLASAVSRVAQLQATPPPDAADSAGGRGRRAEAGAGAAIRERRDTLFGMVEAVMARAKQAAEIKNPPDIQKLGFSDTLEQLHDRLPADDVSYCSLVLLSRDLVGRRNWLGKLNRLLELIGREEAGAAEALGLLDGVVADVVGAPNVMRDLLGESGSLAVALANLIDLSRGCFAAGAVPTDSPVLALNEEIGDRGLHATVEVMLDLVRRQFKSSQPLARAGDLGAENAALDQLLAHITGPDGVYGGGPMAEALVWRQGRYIEAGGATGRKQAISDLLHRFTDPKDQVRFLITLSDSELGRQQATDLQQHLTLLTEGTVGAELFRRGTPIRTNLSEVSTLFRQIRTAPMVPVQRDQLAARIDEIIADYVVRNRVIERLDNPEDHLRHRAIRLMQLCSPEVLCSPKTLAIARERIVGLLRQPGFQEKFCEGLPPDEAEKKVREFYSLLMQAGFR
ncbi:MAG: hypothetical protein WCO00_17590 [Rhodospirillaceae bacterium]